MNIKMDKLEELLSLLKKKEDEKQNGNKQDCRGESTVRVPFKAPVRQGTVDVMQ